MILQVYVIVIIAWSIVDRLYSMQIQYHKQWLVMAQTWSGRHQRVGLNQEERLLGPVPGGPTLVKLVPGSKLKLLMQEKPLLILMLMTDVDEHNYIELIILMLRLTWMTTYTLLFRQLMIEHRYNIAAWKPFCV